MKPQLQVISSNHVFLSAEKPDVPATLVIKDGRIAEILPREAIAQFAQQASQPESDTPVVYDALDNFICPGFHDSHQHVFHAALFPSKLACEYAGTSEQDCVEHMVAFAQTRPQTGWLVSHGWREALWTPRIVPTKASLDKAFPDRPVVMYSGDAHTLWVNSCGLRELGITNDTQPPAGGSFDRDESGELTGVIREAAGMKYVARILSSFATNELKEIYTSYFAKLNAMGVTSVCDMALSLIAGADGINPEVYEALEADDKLNVRVHMFPTLTDDLSNLETLQARCQTPLLRAPGFKQFFDGVSSQHTAWCSEPYRNPRCPHDVGRPTIAPERMHELVLKAAKAGHGVRIHTIGDEAVAQALSIFEEAHKRYGAPKQGCFTMEHIEDIDPANIARFAAAGVVASMQPPHITIDITQAARDLGEKRAARMWPFDQMEQQGVTMAFGTDAPVVPPTSMDVLYTACARKTPTTHEPDGGWYPEHALGRVAAIKAYSYGSACAVGRSHELGTLQEGQYADLVVWDTNLVSCKDDQLQQAHAKMTAVQGRIVFEA